MINAIVNIRRYMINTTIVLIGFFRFIHKFITQCVQTAIEYILTYYI